jgi:hypothetical protein
MLWRSYIDLLAAREFVTTEAGLWRHSLDGVSLGPRLRRFIFGGEALKTSGTIGNAVNWFPIFT